MSSQKEARARHKDENARSSSALEMKWDRTTKNAYTMALLLNLLYVAMRGRMMEKVTSGEFCGEAEEVSCKPAIEKPANLPVVPMTARSQYYSTHEFEGS